MELEPRSKVLRASLESKYQDLLPVFRKVYMEKPPEMSHIGEWNRAYKNWLAGTDPDDPDLLDEFRTVRDFSTAQAEVTDLFLSDTGTSQKVYRLVVPIDQSLDQIAGLEYKSPPKPAKKKQALRAIKSVEDEIQSELIGYLYEDIRPEGEDWGDATKVDKDRLAKLDERKRELTELLTTF